MVKSRPDVLGIGCLYHGCKQTSLVIIILRIEHKALAVDDLAVLRDRNVNAGPALGVGQLDGLRHPVEIFPRRDPRSRSESRGRPYAGLADVCPASSPQIYGCVSIVSLFNFRFPQCLSLRDESNTRSTCRFNALMTPMRARSRHIDASPDLIPPRKEESLSHWRLQ